MGNDYLMSFNVLYMSKFLITSILRELIIIRFKIG